MKKQSKPLTDLKVKVGADISHLEEALNRAKQLLLEVAEQARRTETALRELAEWSKPRTVKVEAGSTKAARMIREITNAIGRPMRPAPPRLRPDIRSKR